jgi:hypothetical protein
MLFLVIHQGFALGSGDIHEIDLHAPEP